MKRLLVLTVLLCNATLAATQDSAINPAEAITQGRAAMKEKNYDLAVQTFQAAIPAAAQLSNDTERSQAVSALHFYSAIAFSAQKNDVKAREELEQFFVYMPNMKKVDPAKFDARFVKTFNEVAASHDNTGYDGSFDKLYPGFTSYAGKKPRDYGAGRWRDTPEFVLLATRQEKRAWEDLREAQRENFLQEFWARRDPTPGDERNPFRDEWNARVAFADQTFGTERLRGSLADRGRVFVLLGRPNAVRERAMNSKDVKITFDTSIIAREGGEIEVWHYSVKNLPGKIPGTKVYFRFGTQRELGNHVLNFETMSQRALNAAAEAALKTRS